MLQHNEPPSIEAALEWSATELESVMEIPETHLKDETEQAVRHWSSIYH